MDRCIRAGIYGALIAFSLSLVSPVYLYFFPSFIAAIFAIYVSRLVTFREGLVASFMTYVFSEGIMNAIVAATFYMTNEPYTLTIDIGIVVSPLASAFSALIAGYVGVWIVQKIKPARELPQSLPPPLPPV
jgi:hypothetical protein